MTRLICVPAALIGDLSHAARSTLLEALLFDLHGIGVWSVSSRQLAAVMGKTPSTCATHMRAVVAAGVLEVLYPGRYGGATHGAATVYRAPWHPAQQPVDNPGRNGNRSREQRESLALTARTTRAAAARVTRAQIYSYGVEGTDVANATTSVPVPVRGRVDDNGVFHPSICGCGFCWEAP